METITLTISKKKFDKLVATACETCAVLDDADFVPDDYAGGNIDDAWDGGFTDGETSMCREILVAAGMGDLIEVVDED